jgi:hypothetical protein
LKHFFIPDPQCKHRGKVNHLTAAGNYIVAKQPEVVVHAGDHWDMPSFSKHATAIEREGQRYQRDIAAGIAGMEALLAPIRKYNAGRRKKYEPRMVFLTGNHEYRIDRYVEEHPECVGQFSRKHFGLETMGWHVQPFLKPICIGGIYYAHYFYNQDNGKAFGGRAPNVLNSLGFSFVQGHKQGKDVAAKTLNNGRTIRGLIAGSFYQHEERYKGPQGNHHWRGCLMLHEVRDGNYDLLELSLGYLLRNWT